MSRRYSYAANKQAPSRYANFLTRSNLKTIARCSVQSTEHCDDEKKTFAMEKEHNANGTSNRARATAAQILGGSAPKTRIDPKWQHHYDLLMDARSQILRHKENHAD